MIDQYSTALSREQERVTKIFLFSGCRYQFLHTRDDVIPTIDISKKCPNTKCSKPINAPFDKTKHSCRFSWVNFLENGTWHEKSVRKFKETFHLQSSDYFSDRGYMYSLEVGIIDRFIDC